jgi:CheY-like chemotaxis protein
LKRLKKTSISWLGRWPRFWAALANLAAVLVIGMAEYLAGLDLSFALLYLGPVVFTTWRAGLGPGVFVAGLSAVVWRGAILLRGNSPDHPAVHLWNTLMAGSTFAVVAVVLATLKRTNENLEATVSKRTTILREEVAERRRAEEQLQQANAELQRTQLQLIEAAKMETVGRIAAGVAHEVKNPLMTLSMATDYFLQRKPTNDNEMVLLQDMMSEMDGGEVAAQLQGDPLLKETPIVFLTAVVSNEETQKRETLIGGLNYLAKPVELAELTRVIEAHLKK